MDVLDTTAVTAHVRAFFVHRQVCCKCKEFVVTLPLAVRV